MNRLYHIAATGNLGPIGGKNSWTHIESVTVGTGAASGVFKVYDGQDATTGTLVATIDATAFRYTKLNAVCKDGVFCVLSGGNADVTVSAGG